jgi:hypothetical protein
MTNHFAGDPGLWPLRFCQPDGTGIARFHHARCVTDRLNTDQRAPWDPVKLGYELNEALGLYSECLSIATDAGYDGYEVQARSELLQILWDNKIGVIAHLLNGVAQGSEVTPAMINASGAGTCRYCNGTKRALYFSEQGWAQEWRDCHICAMTSTPRKAPASCTHCIDETDCSNVDICSALSTVPSPPAEINAWPVGCHSPNSCHRNGRCMYVGCKHDGKDIATLAALALSSTHREAGK